MQFGSSVVPVLDGRSGKNGHIGLLDSGSGEGSTSRFIETLKGSLFGLMYVLNLDVQSSTSVMILTTLVEALQLSYFAFAPSSFPFWNVQVGGLLASIYSAIQLRFFFSDAAVIWIGSMSVVAWVVLTAAVCAFVGHTVYIGRVHLTWVFWLLQLTAKAYSGVLFLPIVLDLLHVFACEEDGRHSIDSKVQCWTGKLPPIEKRLRSPSPAATAVLSCFE